MPTINSFSDEQFWKAVLAGAIILCIGYFILKGKWVVEAPVELELLEDFEDLSNDIKKKATADNADEFWERINAFADWHCKYLEEEYVLGKVRELSILLSGIEQIHPAY